MDLNGVLFLLYLDLQYLYQLPKFQKNLTTVHVSGELCNDYLENELSIIKPKIICLMGNTAYYSILHGKEISKNHGRLIHKNNRMYFVTFHPAALIYNQKLRKIFNADIKKMVGILQKLNKKYRD